MTGAGSANVAFALEDSFMTLPGTPTWKGPGENVEVGEASLERNLERARLPNDPRSDGSTEGNQQGALSVSWDITDTNFHDIVFAGTSAGGFPSGFTTAPTSTWYLSAETTGTTHERFLEGVVVESFTFNWQEGNNNWRAEMTASYADEIRGDDAGSPATPAAINRPSKDDIARTEGITFTIDGSLSFERLRSLSLELGGLGRLRFGPPQVAVDAVTGNFETSLSVTADVEGAEQLAFTYGSSGATQTETEVAERPASMSIENPAGTLATYNLSGLQPTNTDWQDLVSSDTDTTDPTQYHVTDVQVA